MGNGCQSWRKKTILAVKKSDDGEKEAMSAVNFDFRRKKSMAAAEKGDVGDKKTLTAESGEIGWQQRLSMQMFAPGIYGSAGRWYSRHES